MKKVNLPMHFVENEIKGSVSLIKINRPSLANSYTQEMLADIEKYLIAADEDARIKSIVITGEGCDVFCAGADQSEINHRDWRSVLSLKSAAVFQRIRNARKVTIAAVNGAAVGGGFELILCCDIRIAVEHAQFWLPEPELGLLPAAAATNLLPKLIGPLRARDLILGGARWTAQEAYNAGLLSQVVPRNNLVSCIQEWVSRIETRNSDALLLAKQSLDLSSHGADTTKFDLVAQALLTLVRNEKQ